MRTEASWRIMLMLSTSVAGCQSFASSSHSFSRRYRHRTGYSWRYSPQRWSRSRESNNNYYYLSLHNRRKHDSYEDIFLDRPNHSPDSVPMRRPIFEVVAASLLGAFSFTFSHAEAACAFDTAPFSILQHEIVTDISPAQTSSLYIAYERFLQEGAVPMATTSRTTKLMQVQTILSSVESTTTKPNAKTKESVTKRNAKAVQNKNANPDSSKNESSSSAKQTQPKSTSSTEESVSSDVSSQKSKKVSYVESTTTKLNAKTKESVAKKSAKAVQNKNANPDSSKNESSSSAKQTQPKSTGSTEESVSSDVSSQKSKKEVKGELQAIDVKKIADENIIDVELICKDRPLDASAPIIKIDRETFQKIKVYQPPFLQYLPSSVQPLVARQFQSLKVLKSIPNNQLFFASVCAGSLTEIIRTSLLYPLSTVKARVQAQTSRSTNQKRPLLKKLKVTWLTALNETKRGDWYAGILPSLLIAVPASGVYSGMKEVSRRAFSMAIQFQVFQNLFPEDDVATSSYYSALIVNLLAAFVADITALAIRTPADVLALRLQVFGDTNVKSDFGNWTKDSVALLPAMILTDIPFLMSRIFLNAAITTSGENLGRYEFETITIACLCALLTTPFDVARTRILLPTIPSEMEPEEPDTSLSVPLTMSKIAGEGNGGFQNLYAGWLERTVFLGLGRAWLDPLRVIGYLGIRDALLLKLFD